MSNNKYEFDIDDILAEYYADIADTLSAPPVETVRPEPPASAYIPEEQAPVPVEQPGVEAAFPAAAPAPVPVPAPRPVPVRPAAPMSPAPAVVDEEEEKRRFFSRRTAKRPAPSVVPEAPAAIPEEEEEDEEDLPQRSRFVSFLLAAVRTLFGTVFAVLAVFVLGWMVFNVHPDPIALSSAPAGTRMNLVSDFDNFVNNAASDALGDLTYIRKVYTISESATAAPAPNQALFGSTTNPDDILALIDSAAALLDGQSVAFDPNADFQDGKEIRYYYDETILAIAWKEIINGKCCTCAEVKIANGSQLRRKLAGDSYGSSVQLYATDMAKAANAVVAINGDFYAFRNLGITAYQREVLRCNPAQVDSCFFTASGDMLFSHKGELSTWEEAQQFVTDNDVLFAVAFGPILVENGELQTITSYPIGEINTTYSRSSIGMLDTLHYFLMTINYDTGYTTAATIQESGQYMFDKGCQKAYALDGGQTSILAMNGELVNHVDFGYERAVSDIIYFATALPEEEVAAP